MSHHIYKTEAFVVGSRNIGESNRFIALLTSELGLVRAVAQGIREERSKLRYYVQDGSLITASLVRGREVWRLTSAGENISFTVVFRSRPEVYAAIARLRAILDRLIQGEERHPELYAIVQAMLLYVFDHEVSNHDLVSIEYITTLRILVVLGYVGNEPRLANFFTSYELTPTFIEGMGFLHKDVLKVINNSLQASHL